MKNILGTLESPETRNAHSRLFPETPSPRALDIVSRPEWRAAIEYRVNESLYGDAQRNLGKILFPNIPRKAPTYEEDINAQIFAEEEAVRIDRNIEHLVGIFSGNVPIISDADNYKDLYIAAVRKIIRDAGIGTRTYFDNVPAIKKAREQEEKNQPS